jgi:hypothetical protein
MHHTPTLAIVQTARADAIGKALKQAGWSTRPEPCAAHPGAARAEVHTPPDDTVLVRLLVLTLSERRGQIAELTGDAVPSATRRAGGKRRGGRPAWRLTAYNPPQLPVIRAALAAADGRLGIGPLDLAGWDAANSIATTASARLLSTRFTCRDQSVTAVFHPAAFTPPAASAGFGDLGDAGGWIISGPDSDAEATAHTPAAVIAAFALALSGHDPVSPGTPPGEPVRRPGTAPASGRAAQRPEDEAARP